MPIIQDAFFVPEDIATGLATGLYRRCGGVIRMAEGTDKGKIVTFLDSANLNAVEQAQGLGTKALQFVQDHKKTAGIAAVGIAIVSAGALGYYKWKSHEPKVLVDFRAALKTYIDAIRNGDMDLNKINTLMDALDALKTHKNYKKICIQLTAEDLELLVGHIYDYTVKLAHDNSVALSSEDLKQNSDTIINLLSYLDVQKRIFESAA